MAALPGFRIFHFSQYVLCIYSWFKKKFFFMFIRDSLVAQMVKNLPAVQETWAQSLGQEGPLEKGMTTHSSNLA